MDATPMGASLAWALILLLQAKLLLLSALVPIWRLSFVFAGHNVDKAVVHCPSPGATDTTAERYTDIFRSGPICRR